MAFLNYMKMHNCNTSYNIHSIIFETILLNPIINHFTLAIKEIFRRYTLYVNNLDRYYHMIEYTKVEELKEIYDLPINKYKKISYSYELQRRKIKHNRSSV